MNKAPLFSSLLCSYRQCQLVRDTTKPFGITGLKRYWMFFTFFNGFFDSKWKCHLHVYETLLCMFCKWIVHRRRTLSTFLVVCASVYITKLPQSVKMRRSREWKRYSGLQWSEDMASPVQYNCLVLCAELVCTSARGASLLLWFRRFDYRTAYYVFVFWFPWNLLIWLNCLTRVVFLGCHISELQ